MSIGGWRQQDGLWRKILARGLVEAKGTNDVDTDEKDADHPMYNTGSQEHGKPSEGGKKWSRARKANLVPGPKMGAKPHRDGMGNSSRGKGAYPDPKQHSGAYVCCQRTKCPGVRGRPSFRMVSDIMESMEEIFCISCNAPWEWSFEQAVLKGQVPGFQPTKGRGNHKTLPSNPHQKMESPFVDSSDKGKTDRSSPAFVTPKAGSSFAQASIPREAWDACPDGHVWQGFLKAILLGGKEESERMLANMEKNADKGSADCKAVLRAVIIAKPAMVPNPAPQPQQAGAPQQQQQQQQQQQPGEQPLTIEQQQRVAYTEKQAATADVQQHDKALNEGMRLHKQAKDKKLALEAELAAAAQQEAETSANLGPLRAQLKAATDKQALASQKLEAINIKLEQSFPAPPEPVAPAAAPKPAPIPSYPTPGQLASVFSLDNLSPKEQDELNSASGGMGNEAKTLAVALANLMATRVLSLLPPAPAPQTFFMGDVVPEGEDHEAHDEEAKCSYNGDSEQLAAWEQAVAAAKPSPQPAASSDAVPASMAADTERPAAVKRPVEDEEEDFFAAEEQNATSLLGDDEDLVPAQAKKARAQGPLADATSEEVANAILLEIANASAALPQQNSADIPAAAQATPALG